MHAGLYKNSKSEIKKLVVRSGNYHAKVVNPSNTPKYAACLRLRHTYFVSTRGWVSCNGTMQETDRYDPYCQHLAVFHNTHILAYLRLLPWQPHTGFMLEHDFKQLLAPQERKTIIHKHSAELSRLVIAPDAYDKLHASRNPYNCDISHTLLTQAEPQAANGLITPVGCAITSGSALNSSEPTSFTPHALELLFKLFYNTALHRGYEHFYVVVEPLWLRLFNRRFGLGFRAIGPVHIFPDGTRTVAAYASLFDLETSMQQHSMEKFRWYADLDSSRAESA